MLETCGQHHFRFSIFLSSSVLDWSRPQLGLRLGPGGVGRFSSVVGSGSPAVGPLVWGPRRRRLGSLSAFRYIPFCCRFFGPPPPRDFTKSRGGGGHTRAHIREDLSTGYGLRFSTEIYWRKRFSTNTYRKLVLFLQKSPKSTNTSRSVWDNVI